MASPTRRPNAPVRPATRSVAVAEPPERLPRWVPPVVYAVLAILLFREFVFGDANILGMDTLALAYFARDFYAGFVKQFHHFPLWDPYLFGGMPFVEATHGDIFYPPSLGLMFLGTAAMWGWKIILHVFLAGLFTYAWLREIGARRTSAFLGGLLYMLGADVVSLVFPGADAKIFVASLAPLAFWLTERALARRRIQDFAFLALGIALLMFTSHLQLVYFAVWGFSLYALFRIVQIGREEKRPGAAAGLLGMFALAGVLGVGAASVQFLAPYKYLQNESRRVNTTLKATGETAYTYSTSWSLHPEEVFSLLVPDFVGDNAPTDVKTGNTYWGRNMAKYNSEYIGLFPLLLAPLVFLRRRRARDWFFLGLAGLALVYALGAHTPLFRLFYLIPGVKLFRAPSLIVFLFAVSVVTLGAFGFERYVDWARGDDRADRRAARIYLWSAGGALLLVALLAASGVLTALWQAVIYPGMTPDKAQALQEDIPVLQAGCWIAAVLALVLAGIWEATAAGLLRWRGALVGVALLGALDLYRIDRPFIRATELQDASPDFASIFQPTDVASFLQGRVAAGEVFRALALGGGNNANWLAQYGIEQLGGHHPNQMARYNDLVGGEQLANLAPSGLRLLDLTNTVYITAPGPINGITYPVAFQGSSGVVYRNPNALPRAFLVGQAEVIPDNEAVQRILQGPGFDFRSMVALPEPLPAGVQVQPNPVGQVAWTARTADQSTISVTTDRPALLVITDNYYDAWHAELDGKPVPILRADYTFRAVPIPAGAHSVRFYYSSALLNTSATISVTLLLLLGLVAAGGVLWDRRRQPAEPAEPAPEPA